MAEAGDLAVTAGRPRNGWKRLSLALVFCGTLLVIAANAHLVYVAFASHPGCAPGVDDAVPFKAATPAC